MQASSFSRFIAEHNTSHTYVPTYVRTTHTNPFYALYFAIVTQFILHIEFYASLEKYCKILNNPHITYTAMCTCMLFPFCTEYI